MTGECLPVRRWWAASRWVLPEYFERRERERERGRSARGEALATVSSEFETAVVQLRLGIWLWDGMSGRRRRAMVEWVSEGIVDGYTGSCGG